MALEIYDKFITQTDSGETIPNATVSIFGSGGGLAPLFNDKNGSSTASNPFNADENGRVKVYLESGRYNVIAVSGNESITYNDVLIGFTEADLDLSGYARKDSNVTFDSGTNTTLTIKSDDSGESRINLVGDSQGTGIVYVGQSLTNGGGVAYNGDGTPSFAGLDTDYIGLYRRQSSVDYWTAKNLFTSNDWVFRGDIYVNETEKVLTDKSGLELTGPIYIGSGAAAISNTSSDVLVVDSGIYTSGSVNCAIGFSSQGDNEYTCRILTTLATNVMDIQAATGKPDVDLRINGNKNYDEGNLTLETLGYTGDDDANNYTHPSYATTNIDTSGAEVIDTIVTNSTGHVTDMTTRTLTLYNLGYTGDTDANNYIHPSSVVSNVNTSGAEIVSSVETNSTGHVTGMTKRTVTASDIGAALSSDLDNYARTDIDVTFDAGTNTAVTILSDDAGESRINLIGDSQGTGIVYVGQSLSAGGGGIAYIGDGSPSFAGLANYHIGLYRRDGEGDDYWTAKNRATENDWIFRGDIYANETDKVYSTGNITSGTAIPTGGSDNDIYIQLDS